MNQEIRYDLIGDIHGHADELRQLLHTLGYQDRGGVLEHPDRRVIFLGDFIDRGPKIREVLEIVRSMIDSGQALAVMGNHELNALAFHCPGPSPSSEHARARTNKNIRQHAPTLLQLSDSQLSDALDWFAGLPMWLELEAGLRAVHACWDEEAMEVIAGSRDNSPAKLNSAFIREAYTRGSGLYTACEVVLKGKETALPAGYHFRDKNGHRRASVRTRWYAKSEGTLQDYAFEASPIYCDAAPESVAPALPLDNETRRLARPYPSGAPPVFIGHYWLRADRPTRLAPNVACVDYSVAKGGYLTAYRWDGEQEIDDSKFVWVG